MSQSRPVGFITRVFTTLFSYRIFFFSCYGRRLAVRDNKTPRRRARRVENEQLACRISDLVLLPEPMTFELIRSSIVDCITLYLYVYADDFKRFEGIPPTPPSRVSEQSAILLRAVSTAAETNRYCHAQSFVGVNFCNRIRRRFLRESS